MFGAYPGRLPPRLARYDRGARWALLATRVIDIAAYIAAAGGVILLWRLS